MGNGIKKLTLFGLLLLSLAGCKTFEQTLMEKGYRELKGEELKNMISGNTEESSTGSFYFHSADGKFSGVSGSNGRQNSGTWKINENGRICRNWNNPYVPSGCSTIYYDDKTKDIQWYDTDGLWYGTKFHPGNPKKY
ncbi:MAG: DUF995 domain-containing protein [bacterium]